MSYHLPSGSANIFILIVAVANRRVFSRAHGDTHSRSQSLRLYLAALGLSSRAGMQLWQWMHGSLLSGNQQTLKDTDANFFFRPSVHVLMEEKIPLVLLLF